MSGPDRKIRVERDWHKNGQLKQEVWILDEDLHRLDGPAVQEWDENGNLLMERWEQRWWGDCKRPDPWLLGMHRLDGPAVKEFDLDTFELVREEWWRNGKPYTPTAHEKMAYKIKGGR